MHMAKEKNILDPEVVLPKIQKIKASVQQFVSGHKKLVITLAIILLLSFGFVSIGRWRGSGANVPAAKTITQQVDKSFDFPAVNNQGKAVTNKIKMKIATAEKTNQVLVKDQTFTAKNNKLFLIVNLELKNDATLPLNILPGDLIRLVVNGDKENKFAPDLHNNLVPVSALSTRIDRVGFVIPDTAKSFKLYIGELEGKKEEVSINFPS